MKHPVKSYVSQTANENERRGAYFVWSVSCFVTFVWIFLILLAALAEANNFPSLSRTLYKFFSFVCHQIPSRSFHLENHAFGVCARCFGVYFGLLGGLLAYPFFRSVASIEEPFPRFWLFLAMLPMAIDWSLGFSGIWDNTHWSRFLTGAILGAVCAVFIVPALVEISQLAARKMKRPSN
jgi:uncharacterized membrane protein